MAALVDDPDAGRIDPVALDEIALGLLADGHHEGGPLGGAAELPAVDAPVDRPVELGEALEDEVVDGDHRAHRRPLEADGQLVGEAVEEPDAVARRLGRQARHPPEPREEPPGQAVRTARLDPFRQLPGTSLGP